MHSPEKFFRDTTREPRYGSRGKLRPDSKPYARRRRAAKAQAAALGPGSFLRQYWDEHAVKTGIGLFWVWFAAANWQSLQQVSASLWSAVGS